MKLIIRKTREDELEPLHRLQPDPLAVKVSGAAVL